MNPIETFLDFINSCLACSALVMSLQVIDHKDYLVQSWICHMQYGEVVVKSWKGECSTGHAKYWGRPFYVHIDNPDSAMYLDRVGSLYWGQGAMLIDAYQPPCGS